MLAVFLSPVYILLNVYMLRWLLRWMKAWEAAISAEKACGLL